MRFSDAYWGCVCKDTMKSISGYCYFKGSSPIYCRAKKQQIITTSFAEAECKALGSATCELQWLHFLLHDLGITDLKQIVLSCDNKSALYIAANPVFHERTKHLEIACHIVRQKVEEGLMRLFAHNFTTSNDKHLYQGLTTERIPKFIFQIELGWYISPIFNSTWGRMWRLY